ncbi:MAG: RNA polymerase-binding protein RbpA [Propionibacteriaceae bacterium]|jgi:6,7-dimethyl-8-ribityllumazine synthase|nr:RNA polymerase-binding protein RbpA [Propionibacteriaceae bacterium]
MKAIQIVQHGDVRQPVEYHCTSGHRFQRVFAAGVTVPGTWDCPHCGQTASPADQADATCATAPVTEGTKTAWEMLLERRSLDELQQALADHIRDEGCTCDSATV